MVTFEKAKDTALLIDSSYDTAIEYPSYWLFFMGKYPKQDNPVAVFKADGDIASYSELVIKGRVEKAIKKITLQEE